MLRVRVRKHGHLALSRTLLTADGVDKHMTESIAASRLRASVPHLVHISPTDTFIVVGVSSRLSCSISDTRAPTPPIPDARRLDFIEVRRLPCLLTDGNGFCS
jgi:hypothetical protein